jgi:glutathione S-transferase
MICRESFKLSRVAFTSPRFAKAHPQKSIRPMASFVDYRGKPQYDIYVKGSPEIPELGDCPFSHRTMMTFEEKGIRYNKILLDEQKLPEWISDITGGPKQIPFVTELDTGKWLYDSDKIIPYLEDKYPEPPLGKPDELPQIDGELFPSFLEFVKSEGNNNDQQKKLEANLKKLNDFLAEKGGPFFGGDTVNALDLQIAPKLKHINIGGKATKDWEIPAELSELPTFLKAISERESWKQTFYTEKYVQDGWKLKQQKLREES